MGLSCFILDNWRFLLQSALNAQHDPCRLTSMLQSGHCCGQWSGAPPSQQAERVRLAPRRQGSMASSMVAEATEASVLDSVQDGASSIDDGASMDGASARCAVSQR